MVLARLPGWGEIDMKAIGRMFFLVLLAPPAIPQAEPQESTRARFVAIMRGEATGEDVGNVAFTEWEGPPGVRLTEYHAICTNADEADKDFEKVILKFKVVVREPKRHNDGRIVGERAEVIPKSEVKTEQFTILFTDGLHFIEIFSKSMEQNRELEKFLSN
jgi:uncharacterized protein YifE (UPF0438 family)